MSEPLLSVRDLTVDYITATGPVRAVDRLSFDLGRGEALGLAGESGSGKSTAALALLRLLSPPAAIRSGEVLFEGVDLLRLSEEELRRVRWKKISVVFQSALHSLNPVLTVGEQLMELFFTHEQETRSRARERSAELLRLTGLDPSRLTAYPHQLSGGMRQRVMIALALALSPPLVFLDEPTTALDVVVQREILSQLAELREKLGFSLLFITHDLGLMLELCDRVGVLYAGRLSEMAPARELRKNPTHPYSQGLLSSYPELRGPRRFPTGIPGSPPDLRALPSGCRFHPRCAKAEDRCLRERPELQELSPGHVSACHLVTPRKEHREA